MKCISILSVISQLCNPVSSKLTSFTEMDCLSKIFYISFLTVKTVQVITIKMPFVSGTRFIHLGRFNSISQKDDALTTVECRTKRAYAHCAPVQENFKKKETFSSETNPKKLKVDTLKEKELIGKSKRPNYFVAVQISNPDIHKAIHRIQNHIIGQNVELNACMNSIATLHITLMVMSITDTETHERALEALQKVFEKCNYEMCKKPLRLEFRGLGHFNNRVLYAKILENESFERFCALSKIVRKQFADFDIFSSDQRDFNPHLTIAKINFSKKGQKVLKIKPSLYKNFVNEYFGSETIVGIQLLSMSGPKNEAGYYSGKNLIFKSNNSDDNIISNMADVNDKKKEIRMKIANIAQKIFK